MSIKIQVTGTAALQKALRKAGGDVDEAVRSALYIEGEQIMALSKQQAPVGVDGQLRASSYVEPPTKVGKRWRIRLGYNAAHALFVHEGTGPAVGKPKYFPPPAAFVRWVKKFIPGSDAGTESEPGTTAWLVARAVGQTGTAPTKFLEKPLRERLKGMAGRMAKRIQAGVRA